MKPLVDYLARALVDDPTPVEVTTSGSPDDVTFHVKVGSSDLGKIIGKKGRTAKALRTLLSAVASAQGGRAALEIVEPPRERGPRPKRRSDNDDDGDAASDDTMVESDEN